MGPGDVWHIISEPRAAASYRLSFLTAGCAALINAVFGVVIAWVLTRYDFPGKRLADGLVDLPFALPTAVAGITLTAMYSPDGWIGQLFPFRISFTPIGIVIALTFIGLPFVVRMVQPVLENLQRKRKKHLRHLELRNGKPSKRSFCRSFFLLLYRVSHYLLPAPSGSMVLLYLSRAICRLKPRFPR